MISTPSRTVDLLAKPLTDGCGRHIDHLRLSLTDRCNLACRYCLASKQQGACRIDASFAVALVRWLSSRHGVHHVRLTGGEPLLHPHLLKMIAALSTLGTLNEITLTTNGQALPRQAQRLRQAGLARINISLDTLNAERFTRLTRGGSLIRTLRGIEAAIQAKLKPVRLNVVAQRGVNDDELCDLAEWGLACGCTVRFLEMMPIGPMVDALHNQLVPASEIIERLCRRFTMEPIPTPPGQPATDYAAVSGGRSGSAGVIGVIASTTRPFCARCRRLRITARGEILSCLFDTGGSSLATAWDGRELDEEAADRILQAAVVAKPQMGGRSQHKQMIAIGG
jgi:cyclic pyranopterin phosphate synthase